MGLQATKLRDKASGELVDAELHDDLPIDSLFEAEELWAAERVRFVRDCVHAGVKPEDLPQSIHWNWSLKAVRIPGLDVGPLSPNRLFGIKAQGVWQGLLIGTAVGHVSKLPPGARDLVYVDFVESAPWNWDLPEAGRVSRFRGVGRQLIELAVRWSVNLDLRGRLGLHALPQADQFYRDRCAMSDLGPDLAYQSRLRYFEFPEEQAETFLRGEA